MFHSSQMAHLLATDGCVVFLMRTNDLKLIKNDSSRAVWPSTQNPFISRGIRAANQNRESKTIDGERTQAFDAVAYWKTLPNSALKLRFAVEIVNN